MARKNPWEGLPSKGIHAAKRRQTVEMSRLQECGLSYVEIADLFNVDRKSVWRRVKNFRSGAYTRRILTVDGQEFRE